MNYLQVIFIAIVSVLFSCTTISTETTQKASLSEAPKHHTSHGYQNYPFIETAAPKGPFFYLRRAWDSLFVPNIPDGHQLSEPESMQLLHTINTDRITWLGHASFLIKTSDVTILTDPFLSKYASPVSWAGPKRFVNLPIPINKLPTIDIIIVSHNHYDHLDDQTIKS